MWHLSFSRGRGSPQAGLDLTSVSMTVTTTTTMCTFPLVSFIHPPFTTVVSSEDFKKNPALCTCFRDKEHRKNYETRFCSVSVFEQPWKGASETGHKHKVVGTQKKQPLRLWDWISQQHTGIFHWPEAQPPSSSCLTPQLPNFPDHSDSHGRLLRRE